MCEFWDNYFMDLNTLLFTVIKMYEKDDTTIEYRLSLVYIISFSSSSFNVSPDLIFNSVLPFLLIPSTNIAAYDGLLNSYLYYISFHSSIWRVFIQVFDDFSFNYLTVFHSSIWRFFIQVFGGLDLYFSVFTTSS